MDNSNHEPFKRPFVDLRLCDDDGSSDDDDGDRKEEQQDVNSSIDALMSQMDPVTSLSKTVDDLFARLNGYDMTTPPSDFPKYKGHSNLLSSDVLSNGTNVLMSPNVVSTYMPHMPYSPRRPEMSARYADHKKFDPKDLFKYGRNKDDTRRRNRDCATKPYCKSPKKKNTIAVAHPKRIPLDYFRLFSTTHAIDTELDKLMASCYITPMCMQLLDSDIVVYSSLHSKFCEFLLRCIQDWSFNTSTVYVKDESDSLISIRHQDDVKLANLIQHPNQDVDASTTEYVWMKKEDKRKLLLYVAFSGNLFDGNTKSTLVVPRDVPLTFARFLLCFRCEWKVPSMKWCTPVFDSSMNRSINIVALHLACGPRPSYFDPTTGFFMCNTGTGNLVMSPRMIATLVVLTATYICHAYYVSDVLHESIVHLLLHHLTNDGVITPVFSKLDPQLEYKTFRRTKFTEDLIMPYVEYIRFARTHTMGEMMTKCESVSPRNNLFKVLIPIVLMLDTHWGLVMRHESAVKPVEAFAICHVDERTMEQHVLKSNKNWLLDTKTVRDNWWSIDDINPYELCRMMHTSNFTFNQTGWFLRGHTIADVDVSVLNMSRSRLCIVSLISRMLITAPTVSGSSLRLLPTGVEIGRVLSGFDECVTSKDVNVLLMSVQKWIRGELKSLACVNIDGCENKDAGRSLNIDMLRVMCALLVMFWLDQCKNITSRELGAFCSLLISSITGKSCSRVGLSVSTLASSKTDKMYTGMIGLYNRHGIQILPNTSVSSNGDMPSSQAVEFLTSMLPEMRDTHPNQHIWRAWLGTQRSHLAPIDPVNVSMCLTLPLAWMFRSNECVFKQAKNAKAYVMVIMNCIEEYMCGISYSNATMFDVNRRYAIAVCDDKGVYAGSCLFASKSTFSNQMTSDQFFYYHHYSMRMLTHS
jgi:hypothetical protein